MVFLNATNILRAFSCVGLTTAERNGRQDLEYITRVLARLVSKAVQRLASGTAFVRSGPVKSLGLCRTLYLDQVSPVAAGL